MLEINATGLYDLLKPKTVLNIGAFDCQDALTFAQKGCKVYAFEPMDVPHRSHENIELFNIAIGNADKITQFHVSDNKCSGSLKPPKNHLKIWPKVAFTHKISVECKKLDTWNQLESIDLIFADVNGSEAEMIEGATETLKRTKYLFLEVSDKELYQGQRSINEVLLLMPEWSVVERYNDYERFCDILLKNEHYQGV